MIKANESGSVSTLLARDLMTLFRTVFGGLRGLSLLTALILFGGIALNWSWLVSAGIAPILIGVLPCLVMCGVGLCMKNITGGSCDSEQPATSAPKADFADVGRPQGSPTVPKAPEEND